METAISSISLPRGSATRTPWGMATTRYSTPRARKARVQHSRLSAPVRACYDHVRDPAAPEHRPIPVLPDAYFVLRRPDGLVRSHLLEIDFGTHVLERFR